MWHFVVRCGFEERADCDHKHVAEKEETWADMKALKEDVERLRGDMVILN